MATDAAYHRAWRAANPEKFRAGQARYRTAHPDRVRSRHNAWARKRNQEIREWLDRVKLEAGCVDCGYRESPRALQFDHVRGKKSFNISTFGSRSMAVVEAEVAKCEVRCANCHAIKTWELPEGD